MPVTTIHPDLGNCRFEVFQTSDIPDDQVGDTIALMRRFVNEDALTPEIVGDAWEAFEEAHGDPLEGVFNKVKRSFVFESDQRVLESIRPDETSDVEMLIRPVDVSLFNRSGIKPHGDCDDHAMYAAALLKALGIKSGFRTVAADPNAPTQYSHIYVVVFTPVGEVAMDCSHGPFLGWEAPNQYGKVRTWPVESSKKMILALAALAVTGFLCR